MNPFAILETFERWWPAAIPKTERPAHHRSRWPFACSPAHISATPTSNVKTCGRNLRNFVLEFVTALSLPLLVFVPPFVCLWLQPSAWPPNESSTQHHGSHRNKRVSRTDENLKRSECKGCKREIWTFNNQKYGSLEACPQKCALHEFTITQIWTAKIFSSLVVPTQKEALLSVSVH